MSKRSLAFHFAALLSFVVTAAQAGTADSETETQQWNFRVYLDGSEIGYHNFLLTEEDGRKRLLTEAEFNVKFLFITAYRYEHVNEETWQGDCLQEIQSQTDANGQKFEVRGATDDGALEIEAGDATREVPGCVKTFAYWNPDILDEPQLLNSQTGELLPVEIEPVATETLTVMGEQVPARRYRLEAKNMELDIWYSQDQSRWLALESTVKGGRKLRYELSQEIT
jgi:hypothetical protein